MSKYSAEQLRPVAIQIYGELRHVTGGNYDALRLLVHDFALLWDMQTQASFVANFPGDDVERAQAASRYLWEHFDEIIAQNPSVNIPDNVLKRFGFA